MQKETFIVANWKMNLNFTIANDYVVKLNSFLKNEKININVIVCPQFLLLYFISKLKLNSNINLGAQNCHHMESGAFTGETSIKILEDMKCKYIIAGHSERRTYCKETDAEVLKKALISFKHNISPIICIGESLEIRKKNEYLSFLSSQIINSIPNVSNDLLIAYEPVWSIGTGIIPTIEEIKEISEFIFYFIKKKKPNIKKLNILYGGSVNSKNSKKILDIKNIDGLLVGGASLDINEFIKILRNK